MSVVYRGETGREGSAATSPNTGFHPLRARPTAPRRRGAAESARGCGAGGARLWLALAITLASVLWLAVAWTTQEMRPALAPSPEGVVEEETVAELTPATAPRQDPAKAHVEDPLQAVLTRLEPTDRIDDRTDELAYWPIVATDPEREAELGSQPAKVALGESYEVHVVAAGETLLGIAIALGVDEDRLAELNDLADRNRLAIGQRLLVPTRGRDPSRALVSSRGATLRPRFIWPLRGNITTYFGERGPLWIGGRHTGLDIAGLTGDPVQAAEAGTVQEAGWAETRGFGNYVLLDHGLSYRTLYGHLSTIRVSVGQEVARGERIGDVGSTGVSTGPHLHYEVWVDGRPVAPLAYLP